MLATTVIDAPFDWRNPDYMPVFQQSIERLQRLRANPAAVPQLKAYYRENPVQFVIDWGYTFDPRHVERDLPTTIPFLLFDKQVECLEWIIGRWRSSEPGIIEKSRDSGATWLSVALACTLCLFNRGMVIGFGSRKEEYVDLIGSPKSLFEKMRFFLSHLPAEFLDGWTLDNHSRYMRITFPGTGSAIVGEAGDGIGRGDRTSIYFVDESAFLERPQLIDASLSATTNCRIDISTPNGFNNPFAIRRHGGRVKVFTFSWRDDPRKGPEWYAKQQRELDPVTLASEVDCDYFGSVENQLIPVPWIRAAIGAAQKLGIEPTGMKYAGLDVADEGKDKCAIAFRHGIELQHLHSWSGKGSDIFRTVVKAFGHCDDYEQESLYFDSDGLGAGCRGDALVINQQRSAAGRPEILAQPFRGSESPWDPDGQMVRSRRNRDFFANCKAQAWWALRLRFQMTYGAVVEGREYERDMIISIRPDLEELDALTMELSLPTWSVNTVGKILVDKQPDGALSPNLADAVMICYQPSSRMLETWIKCAGL
jgi:phage terminase large subunit